MGAANLGSVGREVFLEKAHVSGPGGGVPSKGKTKCNSPRDGSNSPAVITAGRPVWLEIHSELSLGPEYIGPGRPW